MPIVGFVSGRSADTSLREVAAFRKGPTSGTTTVRPLLS